MEASSSCQAQSYFMHANPTFVFETSDNFYPGSGYPPQRPVLENLGPLTAFPYRAGRDSYTAGQTPKPARPYPHLTHINYQELPCHNGPGAYYDAPISPQTNFFGTCNLFSRISRLLIWMALLDTVDKPDVFYPTPTPSPVLPPIHSAAYTTRRESTQVAGPSSYDVHWQSPAAPSLVERAGKRLSAPRAAPYSPTHARHPIAAGYPCEPPTHRRQSACEIVVPSRAPAVRVTGTVHKKEWGKLAPGQVHVIIPNAAKVKFAPNATVRDFTELRIPAEAVLYAPRPPEYLYLPIDGISIPFSVDGMPAPHIHQLVNSKVRLDGGHDSVFESRGWRTTKFCLVVSSMFYEVGSAVALTLFIAFQWPGLPSRVKNIDVERPDKSKMTNDEFAVHVAARIWQIIRDVKTHKKVHRFYHSAVIRESKSFILAVCARA